MPGRVVLENETQDFRSIEEASVSPLAQKLFNVPGVAGVFFGHDFISITKADAEWQHMKPAVLGAIMEHFMSNAPIMLNNGHESNDEEAEFYDEADSESVKTIKELIETRVRPAVSQDGGDITFKGFKNGIVYLSMRGACAGCPSSTATLQYGIQNLLRHFLPEVQEVRPI